jgi:hypothetical protein
MEAIDFVRAERFLRAMRQAISIESYRNHDPKISPDSKNHPIAREILVSSACNPRTRITVVVCVYFFLLDRGMPDAV